MKVPQYDLNDGAIYYVGRIGKDVAVVNGNVYDIEHQGNLRYVRYVIEGSHILIGDKYFDDNIVVYNKEGSATTYTLYGMEDGYEVKAYIKSDTDFITYSSDNPAYTITSFQVISDEFEEDSATTYTNYFILDDVYFSDSIAAPGTKEGWRRLKENDYEYMRINTIMNYYEGNNGHNGNMVYDNGHEYFTYFNRIFKYAYDNDKFDSRCYTDGFNWLGGEVFDYGFSGLIDSNEVIKQYDKFLLEDDKIHYFGNYKNSEDANKVTIYGDWHVYGKTKEEATSVIKKSFVLSNDSEVEFINAVTGLTTYSGTSLSKIGITTENVDDVTNQIVNNKRFKIIFNMKYDFDTFNGQCELKYIDDIVMNYLTQMVPSTAIFDVEYNYCNFNYKGC